MARVKAVDVSRHGVLLHVTTARGQDHMCRPLYWREEGDCLSVQVVALAGNGEYWGSVTLDTAQMVAFQTAMAMRERSLVPSQVSPNL